MHCSMWWIKKLYIYRRMCSWRDSFLKWCSSKYHFGLSNSVICMFSWIFGQLHEKFHIKLKFMEFQQLHEAASMLCMNAISNEHSHIEHISMPLFNGPCTIINNINWLMAAHLMLRQSDEIFWKIAVARNTTHAKSNPNKLSPVRLWSCDVLWNNDSNLILF